MAIHPSADVHPTSRVHESAEIGPRVIVGPNTVIGEGNVIMAGAIIGPNVTMGRNNRVHYYGVIGDAPQHLAVDPKINSFVEIGDNNVFREHTTVHRSIYEGGKTIVGNDNYFMATVHIAHDCVLGNQIVMTNLAGMAGHVEVGDRAFISGPVGIHQWVRIGRLAMVGGMTGVGQDVPPFTNVRGDCVLVGLNTVGLRRAGLTPDTRTILRQFYKAMFRSGRLLKAAIADLEAEWAGREMPREARELLDFCAAKSKRGIARGPRANAVRALSGGAPAEE